MLRLLHTSDWHLGHQLHQIGREAEHRAFLTWLVATIAERRPHVVLITGDVFDHANPPASAEQAWYGFLADAARACPGLQIVVIAGNHDSSSRLEAPRAVLDGIGVTVVGSVPSWSDPEAAEALVVPVRGESGAVEGWVAAVPFLRPVDLPVVDAAGGDALIAGARRIYADAVAAARRRRQPGQALLATGHGYWAQAAQSEKSERRVFGGNQHALPADLFDADLAYVALGHLHRPQAVGGREEVRYAGSPLPLSVVEAHYPHQVVLVELEQERASRIEGLLVPRTVPFLRIPAAGTACVADVLLQLAALPPSHGDDDGPWLEIQFRSDSAAAAVVARREIQHAARGRQVRLVHLGAVFPAPAGGETDARRLQELTPVEVFRRHLRETYGIEEPSAEVSAKFHELVEEVLAGGDR